MVYVCSIDFSVSCHLSQKVTLTGIWDGRASGRTCTECLVAWLNPQSLRKGEKSCCLASTYAPTYHTHWFSPQKPRSVSTVFINHYKLLYKFLLTVCHLVMTFCIIFVHEPLVLKLHIHSLYICSKLNLALWKYIRNIILAGRRQNWHSLNILFKYMKIHRCITRLETLNPRKPQFSILLLWAWVHIFELAAWGGEVGICWWICTQWILTVGIEVLVNLSSSHCTSL